MGVSSSGAGSVALVPLLSSLHLIHRLLPDSQKGSRALFWLYDTAVMDCQQQDEPARVMY
jgi:hypothetical protein